MRSDSPTTASRGMGVPPTVGELSVVIVTWRRPMYVDRCLQSLATTMPRPSEVVVVDASEDDQTRDVVRRFDGVRYVSFPGGAGHMTSARNEGLRHVQGEYIAFLDDDIVVDPSWAGSLRSRFAAGSVDAVAGRTKNGEVGEEHVQVDRIGRLLADGSITGNFAAQVPQPIAVDHGIGANMAFTRRVLAELGGFRDIYPGTALREDTDMFLRVGAIGGSILFDPAVVGHHMPAPHVRGNRFDLRYTFYAENNHTILLALNRRVRPGALAAYVSRTLRTIKTMDPERRALARVARALVRLAGILTGLLTSAALERREVGQLRRRDRTGSQLARQLGVGPSSEKQPKS